jgi:hypothetical protein
LLKCFHSTPAARAIVDAEPDHASAAALSTADPSTGLQTPAQAPAAAAAQALPAGPANAALDLAVAVDAEWHQQQQQQAQVKRSNKPKSKTRPFPTHAAAQTPAFSSRLAGISKQLQHDAEQVQRLERAQQVTQQLQHLESQHKRRRQQLVTPASMPQPQQPPLAPSPPQQQQQQQGPLPLFDLGQALRALDRKGPPPLSLEQLARQKQQQRLQQQQQQEESVQQQQDHKLQRQGKPSVGLPSVQPIVRAAPRQQLPPAALFEQVQGASAQQLPLAEEAAAASMPQRPFGGYKLPLLVQYMLQQQQLAAPAAAAARVQSQSSLCPGVGSAGAAAADVADDVCKINSAAGSQARYSNWVDFDVSQAVPQDANDTFLGVWPDPSCLPALQLPELSDTDSSYLDGLDDVERQADTLTAASAAGAAGAQLGQQQLQQLLPEDLGWLGTAAAAAVDYGLADEESLPTAAAAAEARSDAEVEEEAALDSDAFAAVRNLLDGWLDGDESDEGPDQARKSLQDQPGTKGQLQQHTSIEQGLLLQTGAAADSAAAAEANSSDWEDDAAATVAASELWAAGGSCSAAPAEAEAEAEIQQLWEADVPHVAATAAAVLPAAPVLTLQQQLQRVAATAGLSGDEAAGALRTALEDSWTGVQGSQQPRWSVRTMFDRINCLVADTRQRQQQEEEDMFEGSSWLLDALDSDQPSLSDGEVYHDGALEAVTAAQQALRASDLAAAAAAAAAPPQRQWPGHIPIQLAWQQAVEELKLQPELAGVFYLDSSSSDGVGGDSSSSNTGLQSGVQEQQPYAWMCGPTAAAAAAGTGAGSQPYGVQYILRCMQAMHPSASWQFHHDAGRSPNSPANVSALPPVDSSLQQYVVTDLHRAQQRQRLQQTRQEQQQLHLSQPQLEAVQPAQTWWQFAGALWHAAAEAYGFSGSKRSRSSSKNNDTSSRSRKCTAAEVDWSWDDQEQQEDPAAAAAAAAAAAGCQDDVQGAGFVLKPQEGAHNVAERLLLARVTQMSAGTVWEPVLWSVFTQQATAVLQGRSLLQPGGAAGAQRKPLSQPLEQVVQQHSQRIQGAQQQLRRKQAQLLAQGKAALRQQTAAAQEEWYAPVLYAAYAGVYKTGQLLLAPVVSVQYLAAQAAASLSSSSSNSSVRASGDAAAAATPAAVPVTVGLQAVPACTPGWDPVSRLWEGTCLKVDAATSRAQLAAERQLEVTMAQRAINHARARAPTNLRLQLGAAEGVILEELQACDTAAVLLDCMQQYSHYLDRYPNLPAAAMQQAAKLWRQATAAVAAEGLATEAAAAAPNAAGSSVGRRHKPLPLALQPALAAAAGSAPSSSSSSTFSVHEATAAALGNMDAVQSGRAQVPTVLVAPVKAPAAAGAVFETLVQWFGTRYNRPKQLLDQLIPPSLHDGVLVISNSDGSGSSRSSGAGTDAASGTHLNRAECLLQLLTLGITGRGTVLPSSLALLQLLQMQEVHNLSAAAIFKFSQQLLSPATALQSWPAAEQQAAFQLLEMGLAKLQPQALLQLLQTLTQQQHLAPLQQQPAALYRAVLARLAVQAHAVVQGHMGPMVQDFMAATPQLLQLAQQACLSAGALALESHHQGVVLPGSKYFTEALNQASHKGFQEQREWAVQQHRDFINQLHKWRKQAAATSAVAEAAVKAAASGHLQLVAAVLKLSMSAKREQQFDAAQAAELLQLLAFSRPCLTYSSRSDVEYVAQKFEQDVQGLMRGSQEFARLPEVIADWLVRQQAGQRGKPLQQLSPAAAFKTVWAALQLQLDQTDVLALVSSLCEPQPAAAAARAGNSSSGSDMALAAEALIQQDPAPGAQATAAANRARLSNWPLLTLHQLLDLLRLHNHKLEHNQQIADAIAAAATLRIRELAAGIAARGAGVASTVNLAAYAAKLPAAPVKSDLGRHRGSASSSSSSTESDVRFSKAVDAACDMAYSYALRSQYQPALMDALQTLVLAVARDRRSRPDIGAQVQLLTARMLWKVLYALAQFNHCSADTSAALRRLLPRLTWNMREVGLSRTVWALAVLDERDQKVWAGLQSAIGRRQRERTAAKGSGDARNAAAGTAEREVSLIW